MKLSIFTLAFAVIFVLAIIYDKAEATADPEAEAEAFANAIAEAFPDADPGFKSIMGKIGRGLLKYGPGVLTAIKEAGKK